MQRPRLLIVEDEDLQYEIYEEALSEYDLARATTATEALRSIARRLPDLIVLDHVLAEGELGLEYLAEMKDLVPHVPIVVISGALEAHQQLHALQGPWRAHYVLTKPLDVLELKRTIATSLKECGEKEVIRQFEALERAKRATVEDLLSRSADRLQRQALIRQSLAAAGEKPNISALSRRFKVARRTIIRDLQELIRRGELAADIYPADAADAEPGEP